MFPFLGNGRGFKRSFSFSFQPCAFPFRQIHHPLPKFLVEECILAASVDAVDDSVAERNLGLRQFALGLAGVRLAVALVRSMSSSDLEGKKNTHRTE